MFKIFIFLLAICSPAFAQKKANLPNASSAKERLESYEKRKDLQSNSLLANWNFRSVGPTVMSGRVVDIDVCPTVPSTFFAAFASGGLWKTTSNGTEFSPLFDSQASMTIGDIAVFWQANQAKTIWVGTGENNASRSTYAGTGIYKSDDEGKTWQHSGLSDSHHIGKIILHPTDPNTLWVAVLGHLYSENEERGIFKSTDAGKTWTKTLFINNSTGVIDLEIDPKNPQILYAAAWQRNRFAWDFVGSGKSSGIYKSIDGGLNWAKMNTADSGFPDTEGVGRIGLAVFPQNPNVIFATLDNQDKREAKENADKLKIDKKELQSISQADFLKISEEDLTAFLDKYQFPISISAEDVLAKVRKNEIKPVDLINFLGDANSELFDTPVKGAEVYRSEDGGKTWKKTHENYIDDLVYSYGYYFGQIRVNPNNEKELYLLGVPAIRSEDGGKTWKSMNPENAHSDHHALWINPSQSGHLILGNDGGVNISYNYGKSWYKSNFIPVGQFYSVNVDMSEPYNVYGGLQDNGVWFGSSQYKASFDWTQTGHYPYKSIMGGDGMQVQIDNRDNQTVYTGYQFGNYFRVNKNTGESKYITPKHQLGELPLRFNWQTPIHLSIHNQDILYFASHKLHRSMNKGETWQSISTDLTKGAKKGNVPYGTITSIDESPLKFGLLYVGSDDGLLHVSKDHGNNWTKISDALPQDFWVSRVEASQHLEGRIYVSLNGYRWDNMESLLFVSDDFGKNWKKIGTNLPKEPINVIKEDPAKANLLYVGTDHGLYVSLDQGESFMGTSLPAVAVHDLAIQTREKDLVVATHGRSLYIADLEHLHALTPEILAKETFIFPLKEINHDKNWGTSWSQWAKTNEPKLEIAFYSNQSGKAKIRISQNAKLQKTLEIEAIKGLNFANYNLSSENSELKAASNGTKYLLAGEYLLEIELNGKTQTEKLIIAPAKAKASRKGQKKTP